MDTSFKLTLLHNGNKDPCDPENAISEKTIMANEVYTIIVDGFYTVFNDINPSTYTFPFRFVKNDKIHMVVSVLDQELNSRITGRWYNRKKEFFYDYIQRREFFVARCCDLPGEAPSLFAVADTPSTSGVIKVGHSLLFKLFDMIKYLYR